VEHFKHIVNFTYSNRIQTELASTVAKNATKPNPLEIILLQTKRKENNWKTEETLESAFGEGKDQRVQSMIFMMIIISRFYIQ
jgi:hypothetical protein